MNEKVNITYNKLPNKTKKNIKYIIFFTTLIVYISFIVYAKMQTKLYKTAGQIQFTWDNDLIKHLINDYQILNLNELADELLSEKVFTKVINELGLISKNKSSIKKNYL